MPTTYRSDYWYEQEQDVPDVRVLRYSRRTTRTVRTLTCGHTVQPGDRYSDSAWIVDGEFQAFTGECTHCEAELMEPDPAAQSLEALGDHIDDWGEAA